MGEVVAVLVQGSMSKVPPLLCHQTGCDAPSWFALDIKHGRKQSYSPISSSDQHEALLAANTSIIPRDTTCSWFPTIGKSKVHEYSSTDQEVPFFSTPIANPRQ